MRSTENMFEKLFYAPFKRFRPDEFEMIALTLTVMWMVRREWFRPRYFNVSIQMLLELPKPQWQYLGR